MSYDVVIVGASVAGCTAAIRYGEAGLRVALVERNRSIDSYKALCGHFILGGTRDVLVSMGLWDDMVAAGAVTAVPAVWSQGNWIDLPTDGSVPAAISLRRQVLDPLLRRRAAALDTVDLLMGRTVTGVLREGKRVVGVAVDGPGGPHHFRAPLVVGADGHRSAVAELAGVPSRAAPNGRFLYWAYYRGVALRGPGTAAQIWATDPDVAVAVPTDDNLLMLGAFLRKEHLAGFEADRAGALERTIAGLPDAPDLSGAERVSKVIGTSDYPFARRSPTPVPGLALIGDAATASDPVPAVGCGWAFRSASWLADCTIPVLANGGNLAAGLRRYRRRHRYIERYDALARKDAVAGRFNPVQRALFTAAAHDPRLAQRLGQFAMRAVPVTGVLNPAVVLRAGRVARKARRREATAAARPAVDAAVS